MSSSWQFRNRSCYKFCFCTVEMPNFPTKLWWGRNLIVEFAKCIWCLTVGSREGRSSLSKTSLGWSVIIKSMQEGLQSLQKKKKMSRLIS